jgi:hypothetical protein
MPQRLLIAAAVVIACTAPTTSSAAGRGCPKVRHPLARSDQSVLWVRASNVVGCWRPQGRVRVVAPGGIDFVPSNAGPAAVAGRFGALALRTTGPVTDQLYVVVANLRTGNVHYAGANYLDSPAGDPTAADVARLVLTRSGTAAWTTSAGQWPTSGYHVESMDRRGKVRVIDDEPGIDPASLRLRRSRLTWTAGGQRRSALLT